MSDNVKSSYTLEPEGVEFTKVQSVIVMSVNPDHWHMWDHWPLEIGDFYYGIIYSLHDKWFAIAHRGIELGPFDTEAAAVRAAWKDRRG